MLDRDGCLAWALLPLRRYAEFGGRSRRTELVTFYLLVMAVGFAVTFAAVVSRSFEATVAGSLFWAALLCPSLALVVRRLHDTGRSGWWTLLALPGLALSFRPDLLSTVLPGPEGLEALRGLGGLADFALLVLLMWNDDPETNRYGPNPRFNSLEPEAQDLA